MFKIILKALLGTAVAGAAIFIFTYGVVAGINYSIEVFGRQAPFVVCGSICAVVIFSILVSFFRFEAKLKVGSE